VTECSKWGLFTRPLTENWGRGRIQLIGDAAHAMLPNAGQGACQAFEDAYVLARWLDACRDPAEAFANFRRVRIPRVHAVQRLSLANARFKHMRDSAGQKDLINSGKGSVHGTAEWVWSYDSVSAWDKDPDVPAIYADASSVAAS
jgi:salicylate hydroxylase